MAEKRQITMGGETLPAIGQGTWYMGERGGDHAGQVRALQTGLDLGLRLIDTAEMYAEGGAETVVGQAIAGRRDDVYLVSKVYPQNAGGAKLQRACEASLRRLGVETLDLYLLHWRGGIPLSETVAGFKALQAAGKIKRWGVSNLDVSDLKELGGSLADCTTDQVLYNLTARGIEFDLLPFCRDHKMPVMAYSPLGQAGPLLRHPAVGAVAHRLGISPAQVLLAWVIRGPGVMAIPKASKIEHVREMAAAVSIELGAEDIAALDRVFPPPQHKQRLEML